MSDLEYRSSGVVVIKNDPRPYISGIPDPKRIFFLFITILSKYEITTIFCMLLFRNILN